MHDLKKIEGKFHEYLKSNLDYSKSSIEKIKITEELLKQQEAVYIPFGWISYFLVIEDEKPVIYANACSRMDLDIIAFIDEEGWEEYDVWYNSMPEVTERYYGHAAKVKGFKDKNEIFLEEIRKNKREQH